MTLSDTLENAQALVDMVADTVQEMGELSVGHTPGGAEALNELLGDSWRYTGH